MKVGIITFHWATNYGAVLQAYALQTYLLKRGHDVQIINYTPYTGEKSLAKCFKTMRPWLIHHNLLDYLKECRFSQFRKRFLNLSQSYSSYEFLKKDPPRYDVYICGSDQIWNPTFTKEGEGKFTPSYFLDFGGPNVSRIAYAVSFGCVQYPLDLLRNISPLMARFDAISVRENSGKTIMQEAGLKNILVMPDPTLLMEAKDYEALISSRSGTEGKYNFFYMLHSGQNLARNLKRYISQKSKNRIIDAGITSHAVIGIEKWLGLIKSASMVVTNSYHGMIFSILFKKPFIVALAQGRQVGMNDRVTTLLSALGLEDRIVEDFNGKLIDDILEKQIDWAITDNRIETLRKNADLFFGSILVDSSISHEKNNTLAL